MSVSRRRTRRTASEALGVHYTRYSTEEQGSTPEQVAINEELAADEDIRIVEGGHFKDEGVSRSIDERPGLQELFTFLEDHPEVGFLVVNELERLTSGPGQRHKITALCKRLDVTIITEDMGRIDPHDEDAMQKADERAVNAKGEVVKVRRRTKRSLRAKVRNGSTVAMRPAYGVRMKPLVLREGCPEGCQEQHQHASREELPSGVSMLDAQGRKIRSGKLELHPDEYPWLVRIFDWAYEGKPSDWIAKRLTAEGVPTKSGRSAWRGNTVNGILDNPFYKGEMTWGLQQTLRDENGNKYLEVRDEDDPGRLTFASPLGAIIDVAKWEAVRQARADRENVRKMTRRTYDPRVFDNLVFCARCGNKMYGRNDNPKSKNIHWRYYCTSSRTGCKPAKGWEQTCPTTWSMSLKDVLAAFAGAGRGGGKVVGVMGGVRGEDQDSRRRRIKDKIDEAHASYDRATTLFIKGRITEERLDAEQADRDEAVRLAEEELAMLDVVAVPTHIEFTGEFASAMQTLSELLADESVPVKDRVQALHDAGVERVYLDKPGLSIHLRG